MNRPSRKAVVVAKGEQQSISGGRMARTASLPGWATKAVRLVSDSQTSSSLHNLAQTLYVILVIAVTWTPTCAWALERLPAKVNQEVCTPCLGHHHQLVLYDEAQLLGVHCQDIGIRCLSMTGSFLLDHIFCSISSGNTAWIVVLPAQVSNRVRCRFPGVFQLTFRHHRGYQLQF